MLTTEIPECNIYLNTLLLNLSSISGRLIYGFQIMCLILRNKLHFALQRSPHIGTYT